MQLSFKTRKAFLGSGGVASLLKISPKKLDAIGYARIET